MSQGGYLAIVISLLVGLGVLAFVLFVFLRKGPKPNRPKCEGCRELSCPIVRALCEEEKK